MDPVFLVGVPRSGTTMIRMVLDSHVNIYASSETPWLGGNYENANVSLRGLYERMKFDPYSPLHCMSDVDEEILRGVFREFIISIYRHQLSAIGKKQWVEKTPDNIIQLPFLHDIFPNAKFIHVIRDGRDVALSTVQTNWPGLNYFRPKVDVNSEEALASDHSLIHRINLSSIVKQFRKIIPTKLKSVLLEKFPTCRWWKPCTMACSDPQSIFYYNSLPNTYYHALWRWREWISKFEKDVITLGVNSITVRYEDLVINPVEGFSRVFDFIGEDWSPNLLMYKDLPHDVGKFNDTGVSSWLKHDSISLKSVGKWKKQLSWWQKRLTHKHFDSFLMIKGYEKTI